MLIVKVSEGRFWNEATERFMTIKPVQLQLEHSLISLSKWESTWKKPFLDKREKTPEEMLDYIRCMTLNRDVDPLVYDCLNEKVLKEIKDYIDAPMTATWFSEDKRRRGPLNNREIITAEIIYYWMVTLRVPFECQKWHLNRLLTLIRVIGIKNEPPRKMSNKAIHAQNRSLNAAHRRAHHSKG